MKQPHIIPVCHLDWCHYCMVVLKQLCSKRDIFWFVGTHSTKVIDLVQFFKG